MRIFWVLLVLSLFLFVAAIKFCQGQAGPGRQGFHNSGALLRGENPGQAEGLFDSRNEGSFDVA